MKFGLFGGARARGGSAGDSDGYHEFIRYVVAAEELGFSSVSWSSTISPASTMPTMHGASRSNASLRPNRLIFLYTMVLASCSRSAALVDMTVDSAPGVEDQDEFFAAQELTHGSLINHISTDGIIYSSTPKRLDISIPSDTTQIEMWFHNFAEIGGRCDAWDSRFGANYWFEVGGPNPVEVRDPVRYRDGAIPSVEFVNTVEQSAIKRNVFPVPPSGPRVGKDLRTSLNVIAWVKNVAFKKDVWTDIHVFDRDGNRIQAATFPLSWEGSASGAGDLFQFDEEIYQGSIATPGSVSPKPNAWLVQYRLYYAVAGRMYTDAILHEIELPDDAVT